MSSVKTALITGASRGIGKAIAREFAAAGYNLILTCSSTIDMLKEYSSCLEAQYPVKCTSIQADMGNYSHVKDVFSQITDLDVLVNNAGISYIGLLSEMEADQWRNLMSTNLDSCFYTCRLAIPLMLRRQAGRIINISSVWGSAGASMEVAYSASKGGVNAFTRALAKELAPSNIQVNAVSCGVIQTQMNECFTTEEKDYLREEIPADRFGTAAEVARLVLQVSQSPEYMTGQIITIDGGWY